VRKKSSYPDIIAIVKYNMRDGETIRLKNLIFAFGISIPPDFENWFAGCSFFIYCRNFFGYINALYG
jgi:hypothetical protein